MIEDSILEYIRQRLGDQKDDYRIPPPIFTTMSGEFIAFDQERKALRTRFPVLGKYLNPYGSMQGGVVAAAVDNTVGPLSMLVALPSVTRRLELKYSNPITLDIESITVKATFLGQEDRWLRFKAEVRDPDGNLLARAKSVHWIVDMD